METLELTEDFWLEEGLVRARISEEEISRVMKELDLNPLAGESWEILERMTQW